MKGRSGLHGEDGNRWRQGGRDCNIRVSFLSLFDREEISYGVFTFEGFVSNIHKVWVD